MHRMINPLLGLGKIAICFACLTSAGDTNEAPQPSTVFHALGQKGGSSGTGVDQISENTGVWDFGNFTIELTSYHPVIYKLSDREKSYSGRIVSAYKYDKKRRVPQASLRGYFDVNGRPEKLTVETSGRGVIETSPYGFNAKRAGSEVLYYRLGDRTMEIELLVEEVPIPKYSPVENVIQQLGLPSQTQKYQVKWPCSSLLNGLYYDTSDGHADINVEHWVFDKYPGMVLSIKSDVVSGVSTISGELESQSMARLGGC